MSPVIGFAKNLPGHLAWVQKYAFEFAWLEAPIDARVAFLSDVPDWQNAGIWPSGRVFGNAGEYRWQCNVNGTFHAVLLLEDGPLPWEFGDGIPLRKEADADLILWGKWIEKDSQANPEGKPLFYANEIPRAQAYPISLPGPPQDDETPRILTRRYRAIKDDAGEFMRCVTFRMRAGNRRSNHG